MFRRIVIEEWHNTVAAIAFAITAGVFIAVIIRTFMMKRDQIDHAASLPLDDSPPPQPSSDTEKDGQP
jgi:cbb3-type cytochrome oxidase subunit 3